MEKKKEITKVSLVKQPTEKKESSAVNIIYVTNAISMDKADYHYLIGKDGQPEKGANKANDSIIICLQLDGVISWTQKRALVDLVKVLQPENRYTVKPLSGAPLLFDLNNLLIKYSLA